MDASQRAAVLDIAQRAIETAQRTGRREAPEVDELPPWLQHQGCSFVTFVPAA